MQLAHNQVLLGPVDLKIIVPASNLNSDISLKKFTL